MFANSNSSSEVSIDLIPDPVEEEKEPEIDLKQQRVLLAQIKQPRVQLRKQQRQQTPQ